MWSRNIGEPDLRSTATHGRWFARSCTITTLRIVIKPPFPGRLAVTVLLRLSVGINLNLFAYANYKLVLVLAAANLASTFTA